MRRLVPVVFLLVLFVPAAAGWTWPVSGDVLERFSFDPDHPYAAGQHRGIAIAAPAGADVRAPAGGVVTFAGTVPTSGKTLTITTPGGLAVALTHLGALAAARGDSVAEGDVIGSVGPSGTAEFDVPYVHLGVRKADDDQGYLDPLSFLPVAAAPAAPPSPAEPSAPAEASPAAPAPAPVAAPAPAPASAAVPVPLAPAPAPRPAAPPAPVPAPTAAPAPAAAPAAATAPAPVSAAAPEPTVLVAAPGVTVGAGPHPAGPPRAAHLGRRSAPVGVPAAALRAHVAPLRAAVPAARPVHAALRPRTPAPQAGSPVAPRPVEPLVRTAAPHAAPASTPFARIVAALAALAAALGVAVRTAMRHRPAIAAVLRHVRGRLAT